MCPVGRSVFTLFSWPSASACSLAADTGWPTGDSKPTPHLQSAARRSEQAARRCPPPAPPRRPFSSGLGASPVRACVCEGRRLNSGPVRYPERTLTTFTPPSLLRGKENPQLYSPTSLPATSPPPAVASSCRCSPSRSATVLREWDFHGWRHRLFCENKRGNGGGTPPVVCRVAPSAVG